MTEDKASEKYKNHVEFSKKLGMKPLEYPMFLRSLKWFEYLKNKYKNTSETHK